MSTKNIIGIDLGPNSIGWAVINKTFDENEDGLLNGIKGAGVRIIPMDAATLDNFSKGVSKSQTENRTKKRCARRLYERSALRRQRLNRVLDIMGFLPDHYSKSLDLYGKSVDECKIAWFKDNDGQWQFLFKDSYQEMLNEFRFANSELCQNGLKIPYDWTLYFLRKKALYAPLTKQELSWVLHSFNQKRGYFQDREEEKETDSKKKVEYATLKIVAIEETNETKGEAKWYNFLLENGLVYKRSATIMPDWVGQTKEFIVTTDYNKDGSVKKKSLRMPNDEDWTLQKKKTEYNINKSGKTVGEFIYDALLLNLKQKIRGKLVRHIEREYYEKELREIISKQKNFIPQLCDRELYEKCITALYPSNDSYRESISKRDFDYLLIDDIILYQRPLKSKKHLIADCPFEYTLYTKDGKTEKSSVKCIAKSHPLFQEFRLWKFIHNLRIYKKQLSGEQDVTETFLPTENDRVRLFEFLNDLDKIKQIDLFTKFFGEKKPKIGEFPYRWNYVEDKEYPCNETRHVILKGLKKSNVDSSFLTPEIELHLWHILYSISDKTQLKTTLERFAQKHNLPSQFAEELSKTKPFDKDYGSYSAKAYKKLLPLMRMGKYWSYDNIDNETQLRISKLITGEYDENISDRVRTQLSALTDESLFKGLHDSDACYIVYGKYSEAKEITKWHSPDDIDRYINEFRQHSLNNPIVEQVVLETLRTVRDLWKQYGSIDEIHIELGREMKSSADERKRMTERINENENRNIRIKRLLAEFANPEYEIENVRPYSQSQQDLLRIYESQAIENCSEKDKEEVSSFLKSSSPSRSDFMRYKLWLDQKYISPYTGRPIPLSKLFTHDYEIEHIIPQSRYFDDSFSNKVICESEVNKLKDNQLGLEFIKQHRGQIVQLNRGGTVEILSDIEYEKLVSANYSHDRAKQRKLLLEEIPDEFINRQLNDTRYISRLVMRLLSNIVREPGEEESTSKNLIPCNGAITDRLKKDWGVNDVWNRIILPRFQRLEGVVNDGIKFTTISQNGHEIPSMPLELQKGFNKKRIDHRHHAMDAIVIACTSRNHVNLLNNEAAKSKNSQMRHQLSHKLRRYEPVKVEKNGNATIINVAKEFFKPWDSFPVDVEKALREIVVSFKQNLRVINRTSNSYQKFENGRKTVVEQKRSDNWWAIRKSLHKDTVYGEVNLRMTKAVKLDVAINSPKDIVCKDLKDKLIELLNLGYDLKQLKGYFEKNKDVWQDINVNKIQVYYYTKDDVDALGVPKNRYFANRTDLVSLFDKPNLEKSLAKIEKITDTGIQKILKRHLESCDNNPTVAFSPEGIDIMNKNIKNLNNGKPHQPIYKVRVFEKANKFPVGQSGNKSTKFVEADKGTNLFFAVYEYEIIDSETGLPKKERSYKTIPLNEVIDRLCSSLSIAPDDENGNPPKFVLSPNDLVYLPTEEERANKAISKPLDRSRIYKMVSFTRNQALFIQHSVASVILDGKEFEALNKMERAITGEMIKSICVPLKIDRLGNIIDEQNLHL